MEFWSDEIRGFEILKIPNNKSQITNKLQFLKFQKSNGFNGLLIY
jgi:hypothetical protein